MALRIRRRALLALTGPLILWAATLSAQPDAVTVFAAASLGSAMREAGRAFEAETGVPVTVSAAGSSVLARQIENGAPATLFVSANSDWMDYLEAAGLVVPGSRRILLSNRLVLIGRAEADPVDLSDPGVLPARLGDGRLAMALVAAVPAGIYGKATLEHLGMWPALSGQVAQADNVRAALALVASGEAPFGIVYATDALAETRVRVVAEFPADSHPPILYPAALVAGQATDDAARFLDYLSGPQVRAVFRRHGFAPVAE